MDQVTQQNAALVEQAAAAAASLQEQAGSLVQAVSVFRLDRSAQQPPAIARKAMAAAPAAKPRPKSVEKAPRAEPALNSAGGSGDWTEF